MNTRAWIVFLDESSVWLLPQIRRTHAPTHPRMIVAAYGTG
ncbi:hypothetical protein [Streptomyces sp. NPDC088748]